MYMFYQPLDKKLVLPFLSVSPGFDDCMDTEKEGFLTGKHSCKNYASQVTLPPRHASKYFLFTNAQ